MGSGLQRAQAFMILATMLYRASHLMVGLVAVIQHQRHRPVSWLVLAAAVGCSVLVYGTARSRGWFAPRLVWADVLITGCVLPFVAYAWSGVQQPASIAWVMLLGGSASAAAAVTIRRPAIVGAVVVLLAVTHLVGYRMTGAGMAVVGGHLNAVLSSAVMAWVFWWYLRKQGSLLDAATEQAMTAEAERARYAERIAHHRALHDTVLATLTTIAGGGIDANTPQVRGRCAREAAYLRRLIQQNADSEPSPETGTALVGAALEESVRSAESLDLVVTAQYCGLPTVPTAVATALAAAVTEAFNNVLRHAGTGHAYLTATGDDGQLVVTVVDRGVGFDPARVGDGLGLRHSVHARMRTVGGVAEVDSAPGDGARIELRWPG
ncbi:ATP-binding protein [Streptomyces sp. H27-H1]|uniref:sensor histidine kinase n=1 Tax=Streptomyces sp. H27-H1 TaxID=2996461 RepID=UPI00226FAE22|nr:ATP-binding protein [Streptomyces sp. H27-H1]MCY0932506.1 ATP-binding protein [Streptomyces sp. H27-H1]